MLSDSSVVVDEQEEKLEWARDNSYSTRFDL
jgi:hypothetical protein